MREVASLAGPRMPADHGLGGLGLIMQVIGSISMGLMAVVGLLSIFDERGDGSGFLLIGVMGALRATFHRMAGSALLDTAPAPDGRSPGRAVRVYAVVSALQTAMTLVLLLGQNDVDGGQAALLGAALMAWPLTLVTVLRRPRFRAMVEGRVPASEDLGFEGAAVLMTLFGAVGVAFGALMLSGLLQMGVALTVEGILAIGVMGMLLVRSILHTRAGLRGTSGIDTDRASDSAARYYTFGVVSSVVAGSVLLIEVMMNGLAPPDLLVVGGAVFVLMVWPLALRRFFAERNFSALLAGAHGPSYRRAPDAGLTALGWLLLASGVVLLAAAVAGALLGPRYNVVQLLMARTAVSADGEAAALARSPFWLLGAALAQLWAAGELITMSDRYRAAATTYGAVAATVVLYLAWPVLADLRRHGLLDGAPAATVYVQMAWMLALPLGCLALGNRNLTPVARARVRVSPPTIA